jgi:NadR type nicotinamide-nucleotide adenylyltransferase
MLKKIVIIGPESTGKSTLCEQLAQHYNTLWCPEYAREYLLKNGTKYSYDDLLTIAKGQVGLEEKYESLVGRSESGGQSQRSKTDSELRTRNLQLLFIDTNMYVMKVWCEFVFGTCHQYILGQIAKRKYDLYLLCNIDLPWTHDELREYPDLERRQKLYRMYKDLMINQPVPWVEIGGNSEQRLNKAIKTVNSLIKE